MLIEWSEAVRYGNWHWFEEWAKNYHGQALADCIAAVESSIGSKPARRALRKALHILAKQGIESLEPDEEVEKAPEPRPGTHRVAAKHDGEFDGWQTPAVK